MKTSNLEGETPWWLWVFVRPSGRQAYLNLSFGLRLRLSWRNSCRILIRPIGGGIQLNVKGDISQMHDLIVDFLERPTELAMRPSSRV